MKKDVLFLCQYFYPEENSSATLPFDTACALAQNGWTVDVLCGWPKEYSRAEQVRKTETVSGVCVCRLRYLQLSRAGKLGRLINFFSFTVAVLLHIGTMRKYRTVMVYSNPPILPLACVLANALFGTQFVFVVYDVYPEIAEASGRIGPGGLISRFMRRLNHSVFHRAAKIVSLTDEMRDYLLQRRPELDAARVTVIANWAHEEGAASPNLKNADGKLVVSYFGNLGICQDADTLLDAMDILRDDQNIRFLFAAHGSGKERVWQRVSAFQNVELFDYLTGEDFARVEALSDCGIVSLNRGLKGMCAPSKYYSYLCAGQAVVAVVDNDSYLMREICDESIGASVVQGEGRKLAEQLRTMAANPHETAQMGARARRLYEKQYSRASAMQKYRLLFKELLGSPQNKESKE